MKTNYKPTQAIWINPDSLEHVYCTIIGRITEYSSLVDFGDYEREVLNSDLREIE